MIIDTLKELEEDVLIILKEFKTEIINIKRTETDSIYITTNLGIIRLSNHHNKFSADKCKVSIIFPIDHEFILNIIKHLYRREIKNYTEKSTIELQNLDSNCNNCKHFIRNIQKTKENNNNFQIIANKIHYGICSKFNKDVNVIANILLLHTQECFENRKSI